MRYVDEIQRAKRQLNYYTELQTADERRLKRAKRAFFWHKYGKLIDFIAAIVVFSLMTAFVVIGMMWAEGEATTGEIVFGALSAIISMTISVLLWNKRRMV